MVQKLHMQTHKFTLALAEISKELKIPDLVNLMAQWLIKRAPGQGIPEEEKNRLTSLLLESRSAFGWLDRGEPAHSILNQLDVPEVYETERFRRVLNSVTVAPNYQTIRSLEMFGLFEVLKSIQRIEVTCRTLLDTERVAPPGMSSDSLDLEIVDYDGTGIEAARFSQIVSALIELHTNVSLALGTKDDKLKFEHFDSGSDVFFSIKAAAATIVSMSGLFLHVWSKVRFRDNETFERDIDSLTKGLEFVGKLQEAVQTKSLTEEEAKNLKTRVFSGIATLVRLGTTRPLEPSSVDERELLIGKRDTKLLGTGLPIEVDSAKADEPPLRD